MTIDFDRSVYPGTFDDQVRSITARTDSETAKIARRYANHLKTYVKIKSPERREKFKTEKLEPIYEMAKDDENVKQALYLIDKVYKQKLDIER